MRYRMLRSFDQHATVSIADAPLHSSAAPVVALAIACAALIFGSAGRCQAEEADNNAAGPSLTGQADPAPVPDPALGIEAWRKRVEQAKARAVAARALARTGLWRQSRPTAEEAAAARSALVLQDEGLMRGDIVSTTDGLFVFRGEDSDGTGERLFAPVEAPPPEP